MALALRAEEGRHDRELALTALVTPFVSPRHVAGDAALLLVAQPSPRSHCRCHRPLGWRNPSLTSSWLEEPFTHVLTVVPLPVPSHRPLAYWDPSQFTVHSGQWAVAVGSGRPRPRDPDPAAGTTGL